ncbi:predicted protein [Plenodomus lingam JN3]|uniref:Predicted protein n=1 Tax=Leptosphaeria maculans (strain JN3 / isolate v23.1.3 / race Av1-4-5-6-7-8) TaxID=985895 RepID=E5AFS7_LEPMJ|nr:predicted protein [Plenodomus lingam JN3]CBY02066.1 predicted protein [Plenodomus lingam JN3]
MLGSTPLPATSVAARRHTYTGALNPPLPPRRNSLATGPAAKTAPLQINSITLTSAMESRYARPASPRGRYANPARSSTGTFADPYYDYTSYRPSSPRSSVDRLSGSFHSNSSAYYTTPATSNGSRASNVQYDSYAAARPRRNTNDHTSRPNVSSLTNTSLPLRTPYSPHGSTHHDRPSSPLVQAHHKAVESYITPSTSRSTHKKVYSVDDASHSTRLVADVETPRHRDTADRGYSLTSGGRSYHTTTKAPPRLTELGDDGYSYTDPASMYRDTEPAWRRPRAGSVERGARPSSMIMDRSARSSARELGPPPTTRGLDKFNSAVSGAIPRGHSRAGSLDKARDIPLYDPYAEVAPALPARTTASRQRAPTAIHQEPRDHRRDTYHEDFDRRDRDTENRRLNGSSSHFEDHNVSTRGFGIAPGIVPMQPSVAHDHHALDREPVWPAVEVARARPQEPPSQYYQPERAEARMPEPRLPRERDLAAPQDSYEKRPREREGSNGNFVPAAAGAAAGVAAGVAAGFIKSRDKDRIANDRDASAERERERRREYDERDRRDRADDRRAKEVDDRRERRIDERRDIPLPATIASAPPIPGAYPPPIEADHRPRERRYEDEDRERLSRKQPSSEGSGDERPRHYVDRDAERKKESAPKEAAIDPDEDYRRRVQQEAERSSRSTRDRDSDSDRERERRRRKSDRDRSRDPEERSRASPPTTREAASSRYEERSSSIYDAKLVQEPESLDRDASSRSVQIVTPPKEAPQPVKGILRKPTSKFPEDPEPIREGVAPHKDALKGKDIPVGARWTRIDRRLVNPEALEQAKERFEERMDCVIVLRVLTKEDIQKLADRTRKIREQREDEYERRDKEERSKRSSRDGKDERDDERDREYRRERERRRRYDDDSDHDGHEERERERERNRPKKLEIEEAR